jgi:predicted alpha/beta-hydrolase family hydrolase
MGKIAGTSFASANGLNASHQLSIPLNGSTTTTARVYNSAPPQPAQATIVLGHGAGAGQDSAFVVEFARALAALGVDVVTFNFPYTEARRRIPDRQPILEACYNAVVAAIRAQVDSAARHLFIGGKSMGGRIASHIAAADPALPIDGLALLGYPLHPPGKPEQRRDKHLAAIKRPTLIVQGSRDAFGTPPEFESVLRVMPSATLHVVNGGDHSFKISKRDPAAQAAVYGDVQKTIVEWIRGVIRT